MNKEIKDILEHGGNKEQRLEKLSELLEDINFAKKVLNGEYEYCPECDDYYLSKSFFNEETKQEEKICTYRDIINSGGNEYADGYIYKTYRYCPKGHKKLINSKEKLK